MPPPAHLTDYKGLPRDLQKYWFNRYRLFSKYNEGILLTNDSWYGVTPEAIAIAIANYMATNAPPEKTTLIDAFCGVGGNTIAFALSGRWERIFAIEQDPIILACAKRNAEIYGVSEKIWWIEGDCFEVIQSQLKSVGKESVIFASPPWGGPSYKSSQVFNLSQMQPYSIEKLFTAFSSLTTSLALYLPRNSDLRQLHEASPATSMQVRHYCMSRCSKALCVYQNLQAGQSTNQHDMEAA